MALQTRHRGDFLATGGLFIVGARHELSVRCTTDVTLAEICYRQLLSLLEGRLRADVALLLFAMCGQLTQSVQKSSRQLCRMAFLNVTDRASKALADRCNEPGAAQHADGTLIRVTRRELARSIGCSRETASRALKTLEQQRAITFQGSAIVVRDVAVDH